MSNDNKDALWGVSDMSGKRCRVANGSFVCHAALTHTHSHTPTLTHTCTYTGRKLKVTVTRSVRFSSAELSQTLYNLFLFILLLSANCRQGSKWQASGTLALGMPHPYVAAIMRVQQNENKRKRLKVEHLIRLQSLLFYFEQIFPMTAT